MADIFDQVTDQGSPQDVFDQVASAQPADANIPHRYNFGDAMQTLGETFMPNPVATQAAFFNPGAILPTETSAAERYPQGIMQSLQDVSHGQAPDLLTNFFSPNPNKAKDATAIAQDMGDAAFPPAVIANPDSHLDYMKAYATNFIKDLPFSTMGAISEFSNPNNAFFAGAISNLPHVNITAPTWVDGAISKIINFAGGPFTALNDALKDKLSDHLADTIHDKVQNAPGWLDQFKVTYGQDTTSDDVRDMIKNKVDQAVQNTSPNAIQLAQAIIKTKGSNLPGIMVPSKALPGDQWMATDMNAPLTEKPLADVVPGSLQTLHGVESTSEPAHLPDGVQYQMHLSQIQNALDVIQQAETKRAKDLTDQGIRTSPVQVPQASGLPADMQQKLINVVQKEILKPEGNDASVQKAILNIFQRNVDGTRDFSRTDRPISADIVHEGKADAAESLMHDWPNFQKLTVAEFGQNLKNENVERKEQGLPLIDPQKDITVHKAMYPGQDESQLTKLRDAAVLAYNRAKVPEKPAKPHVVDIFDQMPTEPPPAPFNPTWWTKPEIPPIALMDIAQQVGEKAAGSLNSDILDTHSNGNIGTVGIEYEKDISHSGTTSPTQTITTTTPAAENLPQPVHVAHDIAKIKAHQETTQVKELSGIEALNQLIGTLKLEGNPEERLAAIAKASGLSPEKIMAMAKVGIQQSDAGHQEAVLKEVGVGYVTDVFDQFYTVHNELQEWYNSRGPQNLPQPEDFKWLENRDLRETSVDGQIAQNVQPGMSLTEKEAQMKAAKQREAAARFFGKEGPDQVTSQDMIDFKKSKAYQLFAAKQARMSTNKMKQQVMADHGIYDKFYLDSIEKMIDGMDDKVQDIVKSAMEDIHELVKDGLTEIARNDHSGKPQKYQVYKVQIDRWRIADAARKIKESIDEEESKSGLERAKRQNKEGLEEWHKQKVDVAGAEHPADRAAQGKSFDDIVEEANRHPDSLSDNPDTHGIFDKDVVKDDTDYEKDNGLNESGQAVSPHEWLGKIFATKRIYKWGPEERVCALPTVMALSRRYPWAANLQDYFAFKMGGDPVKEKLQLAAKERFSAVGAKEAVMDFAQYENAVAGIVREDLYNQFKSQVDAVKEKMKELKIKGGSEALRQRLLQTNELMDDAAELWVSDGTPTGGAFSRLASGPHKPGEEVDYVNRMKSMHDKWGVPYTQGDMMRWQRGRTPDLWHLLKHPNVINGNILQRIIMFNKAAIIDPTFAESLKQGQFANTNVLQQVADGYQPHAAVLADEQSDLAGADSFFKDGKNPLASIANPKQTYTSKQAFEAEVRAHGMRPVNDYWLNIANYLGKMLIQQKQYHLLNELSKIPLPKFEPYSPDFEKLAQDHPVPQDLHDRLKMVHAATDKEILELADHFTRAKYSAAEIKQGLEDQSRGQPNRFVVEPNLILKEGGWIQAHENTGMVTFYRGSWQSAYVYRTLNDMLKTVFASKLGGQGYDTAGALGALQKIWMFKKQIMINVAPVHYPQMVGNIISAAPLNPLGKILYTGKIATYDMAKAMFNTPGIAKQIIQGTYAPTVGQTVEERSQIRELIEAGSTNVGGYHMALVHLIGKADTTIFPEMTPQLRRWFDLALAGGGTGPALLGEIAGHMSAKLQIQEIATLEAKGWAHKDAVRFTVDKYNQAMYMTNEALTRGSALRPLLRLLTFSPDFATEVVRVTMAALQTPLGAGAYGAAAGMAVGGPLGAIGGAAVGSHIGARLKFSYKTRGQSWFNDISGANLPERNRDTQYWDILKMMFTLFTGMAMYTGMQQYGNYLWAKAQGKNPDPSTALPWHNPYFGTYFNQEYDQDGKGEYLDWNRYRLAHDFININAPLIDAAYEKATGHKPDVKFGSGFGSFVQGKFSLALDQADYLRNINPQKAGEKMFDDTDHKYLQNFLLTEAGSSMPINPYLGTSSIKDKYSENPVMDNALKLSTMFGQKIHLGTPNEGAVSSEKYHEWQQDVEHESFVKKGEDNPMSVFQGGANQPMNAKQRNLMNYFKRNRRAILSAESEESSDKSSNDDIFDSVENPENQT